MTRHELREQVFALLFRVEFNSMEDMPDQVKFFFTYPEKAIGDKDSDFIKNKYDEILKRLPEIDRMLNEKTSGWTTDRIGKVELTILRIGVYEIMFEEDVPDFVAVDEAVEIAKKFGTENSGSFVNGVLAKFLKKGE